MRKLLAITIMLAWAGGATLANAQTHVVRRPDGRLAVVTRTASGSFIVKTPGRPPAYVTPVPGGGSIVIPSVGKVYTLVNGSITRVSKMAPNKKVLEPQTYEITWDAVQVANI